MTVQALIGMHFSAPSLCPSNHKWSAGTEYLESCTWRLVIVPQYAKEALWSTTVGWYRALMK